MNVWLVTPAWGRFHVSDLVFEQRARLIQELAPLGVKLNCVVIADDDNIDLAKQHGFDTIEMENLPVARKVNAGIVYAALHGQADYVSFVGSDNWLTKEVFLGWPDTVDGLKPVISGREMMLVDTQRNVMTKMHTPSKTGVIPWIIPTEFLKHIHYRPIPYMKNAGLDYEIYRHIRLRKWAFHDPHPFSRVDFKSETNITPYARIGRAIGNSEEMPMSLLRGSYDEDLVSKAEELSGSLRRS